MDISTLNFLEYEPRISLSLYKHTQRERDRDSNSFNNFSHAWLSFHEVYHTWGRKKAQQVKVLATKPEDLSLIVRTHLEEEENQLP